MDEAERELEEPEEEETEEGGGGRPRGFGKVIRESCEGRPDGGQADTDSSSSL